MDLEANLQTSKDCIAAWEMEANIPDLHRANSLLAGKRGGNTQRLYQSLAKQGLAKRSMPADPEVEDEDFQEREPKRLKGIASPMAPNPTPEERANKKALEQLAFAHPDWIAKVDKWKRDFERAMTNLASEGWLPERSEHDDPYACEDRGAAIKAGRAKAKELRQVQDKIKTEVAIVKEHNDKYKAKFNDMKIEFNNLKEKHARSEAALQMAEAELLNAQATIANIQTTNKELNTTISELKVKADKLFQYLCKEESKSGQLRGELSVYRLLYANKHNMPPPKPYELSSPDNTLDSSFEDPLSGMMSQHKSRARTGEVPHKTYSSQYMTELN